MNALEDLEVTLVARTALYRTMHRVMGSEPTEEIVDTLISEAFTNVCHLFLPLSSDLEKSFEGIRACTSRLAEENDMTAYLNGIYYSLFMGPGKMYAPPWETLYVSKEHALFQKTTLALRKSYVAHGFIPQSYPHVADDHVGLELHFVSLLAQNMVDAYRSGDYPALTSLAKASGDFLGEHLTRWLPPFLTALNEAPDASLYRECMTYLHAFIDIDRRLLSNVHSHYKTVEALR